MNLDFFENKYFFAIFAMFSTMYAFQIRPNLPDFLVKLFQSSLFRVFILFLVLVRGYKDIQFSILVAAAFVIIMDAVRQKVFNESFSNMNSAASDCDIKQKTLNELKICKSLWYNKDPESVTYKNIANMYTNLNPLVKTCFNNKTIKEDVAILPADSRGIGTPANVCATKYGQ